MDNNLLAAVGFILDTIADFWAVTFPGTNVSVGSIGIALLSIPMVFTVIKKLLGGGT